MTTRLITPPLALAVSLAAARTAARSDTSDLDAEITQAVKTYTDEAEHITGRRFITQTWRLTLDAFPADLRLPGAPLASVTYVKYYDVAGVQQTLAPSAYLTYLACEPGSIAPVSSWPATAARKDAVEVQYVCGYGPDDTFVLDAIKGYILARVQQQFSPVATASTENFERLLDSAKVYL